jgi:hypothetical protein
MAKTRLQGRALPANRLSTWRSECPLYEGCSMGPFVIDSDAKGHTIRRSDDQLIGTFPTFDEAYAAMAKATEEWAAACQPWVYFIGEHLKRGAFVKIGTSINVDKRLKQLQAYSPVRLQVLGKVAGGSELEGVYHLRWQRFRAHGEWFRLTPRMIAEIERLNP